MKSLKHCDVDSASARQPLCQYRAATIHHRLASMYHSCLRNQVWPGPRKGSGRFSHTSVLISNVRSSVSSLEKRVECGHFPLSL